MEAWRDEYLIPFLVARNEEDSSFVLSRSCLREAVCNVYHNQLKHGLILIGEALYSTVVSHVFDFTVYAALTLMSFERSAERLAGIY